MAFANCGEKINPSLITTIQSRLLVLFILIRVDTIVYTERGTIHCICPETEEERDMAFCGFEADRDTLKYRCPAVAYGFECKGREECSSFGQINAGSYGRIVRININKDRRIFTPTPYGSPSWKRAYNRRSSLERINSRLDNSFRFEKHFIRGKFKVQTRMGLALAVMMAMALGHVRTGRPKGSDAVFGKAYSGYGLTSHKRGV